MIIMYTGVNMEGLMLVIPCEWCNSGEMPVNITENNMVPIPCYRGLHRR